MEDRAYSSLAALRRILRASESSARALARETGLTTAQLVVLQIVDDAGETTPKGIAERAGTSQATITALVEKLHRRGFVERRRGESDRRQLWLTLTPAGRAALDEAPNPLHARFSEGFRRLPDWEQAMIVAALERVASLIGATHDHAADPLLIDPHSLERDAG